VRVFSGYRPDHGREFEFFHLGPADFFYFIRIWISSLFFELPILIFFDLSDAALRPTKNPASLFPALEVDGSPVNYLPLFFLRDPFFS